MKKILILLIVLSMLLAYASCGRVATQTESSTQSTEESIPQKEDDLPICEVQTYSEADIQRYLESVEALEHYLSGGELVIWKSSPDTTLRHNDAMAYIYETFLQMPDYGDSAMYLSHIAIIPDVRIGESWITIDNTGIHGQQDQENYLNYYYDYQGQLVYYHDYQCLSRYCRELAYSAYEYVYEYNDAGKLSQIGAFDGDIMEALISLNYDENGRLISEVFQNARVESYVYNINYIYNDLGQVTRRTDTHGTGDFATYAETNYIYDENGLLVQEIFEEYMNLGWVTDRRTINYYYDAAGHLSQKNVYEQSGYLMGSFDYTWTDTYHYTCDQSGRILQEVLTYGKITCHDGEEREPNDLSREITYIYDDFYIYMQDNVIAEQVTEEAVNNSSNYDEYRDNDTTQLLPVAFFALTDVKEFSYIKIELNEDFTYVVGESLYSQDFFSSDRPLVVWMDLNSIFPNRGVMYVDALGIMRYYAIMQSGEDGSVILVEFFA